jgi:ABC-type branched-subunit amino acid transport system permease subunit
LSWRHWQCLGRRIGAIVVTIAYDQTKDLVVYFMDRPIVIQPLVFGLSMVLLVLFMPRGIGGWFEGVRRNRRFHSEKRGEVG